MTRRAVGSIRKIARDRWRVTASAGHDPVTGKRRRIDRTVRGTRTEAERELARLLLDSGSAPSPTMTIETYLVDVFLPHAQTTTR